MTIQSSEFVNAVIPPSSSHLDIQSSLPGRSSAALLFLLGAIVLLLILLILIFFFWKIVKPAELKKLVACIKNPQAANNVLSGNLHTISYFNFQTLKKATKNFHQCNLLGIGGFGPVYLGKLEDGRLVAVKKLSLDQSHQGESEFLAEAWKLYERSNVIDLVDPNMRADGFEENVVLHAINAAFLCLQPHANLRPPMSEIVAMLTCKAEVARTPMKPAFLDRRWRKGEKLSWDTISDVFPSSLKSDSPALPQPPN
ncbi:unnamed protein product [Ilex paraguariensis]|uniref:Uncharacterized protein n=1 Tax=Ilex paraguariensis TaxID=185542 RepID=A0ABC8SZU0_9AQUA